MWRGSTFFPKGGGFCCLWKKILGWDAGEMGCRSGGMQFRWDAGQEGCRTGVMQNRSDAEQE